LGPDATRLRRLASIVFAACVAGWIANGVPRQGARLLHAADVLPGVRRLKVPADRPDLWPNRDWQPMPLVELQQQLGRVAAAKGRPRPYIDRADYWATFVEGELHDAQAEWYARRPDPHLNWLPIGQANLNVSRLAWSDPESKSDVPALWGTTPDGTTGIVVDRRQGRLHCEWSCIGRKLAASTEFNLELPPAAMSRMTLKVPAGRVLSSSVGEVSSSEDTSDPKWNQWQVNLGSRNSTRIRVAVRPDSNAARPLLIVRSNLNYSVRSESLRLLAEFALEPLESVVRKVHLAIDPEIQVTSVEYGDGSPAAWKSIEPNDGRTIIVTLPEAPPAEPQTLRVQGIAQIKPFTAWTLPRIRVPASVDDAAKVTLRIQPPLQAADVRTDGFLQTELTTSDTDGESLVFKQSRPDGTITIVPSDGKPELACRVVTLVTSESNQWTLNSQMEWQVTAGSTFAVNCLIPEMWEIIDVRPVPGENSSALSGWDVEEFGSGTRILRIFLLDALATDRPQRVRIAARRLSLGPGERAIMPPLIPAEAGDVEHFVVVTTGPEWRPILESKDGIELLTLRDLPDEARRIDFLSSRLPDRRAHLLAFKSLKSPADARLNIERFEPAIVLPKTGEALESAAAFAPDPPSEPESTSAGSAESAALELPSSLNVKLRVAEQSNGFDHYTAEFRLATLDDQVTFRWTLAEPAELIGVVVDGRRAVPLASNGVYSIEAMPLIVDGQQPHDMTIVTLEYQVPAALHRGPNLHKLVFPVPQGPVLRSSLELVVPYHVRLTEPPTGLQRIAFDERDVWFRRLLGPFARPAGRAIFNPFSPDCWSFISGLAAASEGHQRHDEVWRSEGVSLPEGAEFVIWDASEATCLSIAALALAALVCTWARLVKPPMSRVAACGTVLCLCVGALTMSAVEAELCASGLTGLVLAVLLPQRALEIVRRSDLRPADEVPVGSTQSFVPLVGIALVGIVLGRALFGSGLAAHGQDDRHPLAGGESPNGTPTRPLGDVLIPVDSTGKPVGRIPMAYVPAELLAQLRSSFASHALPPYLIGSTTFEGHLDESNQLTVLAKFDVHVLASEPLVNVYLPLGKVNLGGRDACRVDGLSHPVFATPQGSGILLELPGVAPLPAVPAVPEIDTAPNADRSAIPAELIADTTDERIPMQTFHVELRLKPPVDADRNDVSTALITVPPGCQTQARFSASAELPVLGINATDDMHPIAFQGQPAGGKPPSGPVLIRPGPATRLIFYWADTGGVLKRPALEMQAGISCLADVSPTLIQLRYHIAYQIQSGYVDSLVWQVPAGFVVQSVQAEQLAGYLLRPGQSGGREMLLEFSRPQMGVFWLTATFALPIDRQADRIPLPLLDPLTFEDGMQKKISLRFHQFALRHASDLRVNISSPAAGLVLKSRSVEEYLKEWNADGARPQRAFELARLFTLLLDVENVPAQSNVRGWSAGYFRPGRLDWTYVSEIDQPLVGPFVYRLHVDPRLRIRAVSVQEDGAERLLRWSKLRETVVLWLNDRATRTQTLRIDSSLPMSASHEIELPRIRFDGATPGPERILLFRDADLAVRLVNPEDFPLPPSAGSERATSAGRDRLVARLDILTEQANPRVQVGPVLPEISADAAAILESRAASWQLTNCVRFQVKSGRADTFVIDLADSIAEGVEVRAIPMARVQAEPPVDGWMRLVLHPDEPVSDQLIVVLTCPADSARAVWKLPAIALPGVDQTGTFVVVPRTGLESFDAHLPANSFENSDWIKTVVPALASTPITRSDLRIYRWPGAAPTVEFHATRDETFREGVNSSRFNLWLQPDGSITGWLGLKMSENAPTLLELDWPAGAHPTALYIGDRFRALPGFESSHSTIPIPPAAKGGLVWLSWSDRGHSLPVLSGPLDAALPWPRQVPVARCSLTLHAPMNFRIETALPSESATFRLPSESLPPLLASAANPNLRRDAGPMLAVSLPARSPTDAAAEPRADPHAGFRLGTRFRVINESPRRLWLAMAAALCVSALSWKTAPFWMWLWRHEISAWLVLSATWYIWLDPSWVGLLLAVWTCSRTLTRHLRASASKA
jgi:hypothetical protein